MWCARVYGSKTNFHHVYSLYLSSVDFHTELCSKIVSLKDPRRWSSEGIRYTAGSAGSDKRGVKPIATMSDHVDYDIQ